MLFNSLIFVVGFPLFCAVYFAVPGRYQRPLLVGVSLAACALAGWVSVAWLVVMTLLGFRLGAWIAAERSSPRLALSVVLGVVPLVALKYTNFIARSLEDAAAAFGAHIALPTISSTIPVGLSFYTFVIVGYLVDVQLERVEAERSLARFTLFTAFFPKFVAGPVERADHFLPQIDERKEFDYARITDGIRIMGWGFFKKLVVADRLGSLVDGVYANPGNYHGLMLALVAILYMFQVYYDFSGYSDMAIGSGRVLGYDLIWNFNRPYAARSVSDYWRRWHISLTTWFFDYIFWPLNAALRDWRAGAVVVAMVTTFVVSGLWHGAQWTFVLFGLAHSVMMTIEFLTVRRRKAVRTKVHPRVYEFAAWATTFTFLMFVDIFFRSTSVAEAGIVMRNMVGGIVPDLRYLIQAHFQPSAFKTLIAGLPVLKIELVLGVIGIAVVETASFVGRHVPVRTLLLQQSVVLRWAVYYCVCAAIVFLGAHNTTTAFLYVRF